MKNVTKVKYLVAFLMMLIPYTNIKSQEIGQSAEYVKTQIEFLSKEYFSNASYNVLYENGEISDVIMCWDNQPIIDFGITASFCKHYIMENNKLSYTLSQFNNISIEKLKSIFNKLYDSYKFEDYYFSKDFKNYSQLYLAENRLATVKLMKTDLDNLPKSIKGIVLNKLKEKVKIEEEDERQKQLKIAEEKKREDKVKSIMYDLFEYDKNKYDEIFNKIKADIFKRFDRNSDYFPKIPSFAELENSKDKKYVFLNTYNAHFKLEDHSVESKDYGYAIVAGSIDVRQKNDITLVSGTDKECNLFSNIYVKIPTIKISNYEVMTEAKYDSITVAYSKGITKVEIENGEVKFLDYEPDKYFQLYLKEKIKNELEGKNTIRYEVSNILGQIIVRINPDDKTYLELGGNSNSKVMSSLLWNTLIAAGILAVIFLLKIIH